MERFGPLRFRFNLRSNRCSLRMRIPGWSCLGAPLAMGLAPKSQAGEPAEDRTFRFDVAITFPFVGSVVRYRRWLSPIADEPALYRPLSNG